MKTSYATPIGLAVAMALTGCLDPFSYGTRAGGQAVPDAATYEGDVYPILLSQCSSCHEAGAVASSTALVLSSDPSADYDMISGLVTPGDPANSPLLQKASGATSHGGSGLLGETSVDYQIIEAWVEQGAAQQ